MDTRNAEVLRDQLRLAVSSLKLFSELQGCIGFVTDQHVELARTAEGAMLYVLVRSLTDNVAQIKSRYTRLITTRIRMLTNDYVRAISMSVADYTIACDAFDSAVDKRQVG